MNKRIMAPGSPDTDDDAPDLALSPWREMLDAAQVRVGRPTSDRPKVSTTIRLDQDVIDAFRRDGPGWQSRINAALKEWLDAKG